jgi:hypothetical protein
MKKSILSLLPFACVFICSASEPPHFENRMIRNDAILTTATATVESIDPAKREVTLKGRLGNEVTFTVDPRVKRFNEIKVGDVVQADYYVARVAELRRPTPDEERNPIQISEDSDKAPSTSAPAAAAGHRIKVVTTIEGLDRPTSTITVKGPRGNFLTARVDDPSNLERMRIGENIVITYTEAVAISLEKVKKNKAE